MDSNIVTQIANEIAKRGERLDLREFSRRLFARQWASRTSGLERALRRIRDNKYRMRVRQPAVADCRVVDTRADDGRRHLYFELSNGQVVRADRPHSNPLIRALVSREVELNAARAA